MIIRIATVNKTTGENPRTYARDITGRTFFPQTKTMELVPNTYAYVVAAQQTMTYDDAGVLLKLDQPRDIWQITSTFATKEDAIAAAAESATLGLEVTAAVASTAKQLGLSSEQVKELAAAW